MSEITEKIHQLELDMKAQEVRMELLEKDKEKNTNLQAVFCVIMSLAYITGLVMLMWSAIMPERAFPISTIALAFGIATISFGTIVYTLKVAKKIKEVRETQDALEARLDRLVKEGDDE